MNLSAPTPLPPSSTLPPVLTAEALDFWYPDRPVFAGWSHHFRPGLTWVRGDNGCGKSTLLRLLGGALAPQGGQLLLSTDRGPVNAAAQPLAYRQQVFWCGPDPLAFEHLTPPEYFGFIAGLYPGLDAALLAEHVAALGLQPHLEKRLDQLSTGTQRKVALAAALVAPTRVVLLDEPLAALDRASVRHVCEVLEDAAEARDQAWIVTSHEDLGAAGEAAVDRLQLQPLP
ncbi:MAG: ATP-binding cassette domain-containing protein [Rubrivivax sp.]|jgi:ABC-type multidrug transport system ATPase subunit